MELTQDFKERVVARVERDLALEGLLSEATALLL